MTKMEIAIYFGEQSNTVVPQFNLLYPNMSNNCMIHTYIFQSLFNIQVLALSMLYQYNSFFKLSVRHWKRTSLSLY